MSPDGSRFAYIVNDSIHVRELDQLDARPLPGTGGAPGAWRFLPTASGSRTGREGSYRGGFRLPYRTTQLLVIAILRRLKSERKMST